MASISYMIKANAAEKLDKIVAGLNVDAVESFQITKIDFIQYKDTRFCKIIDIKKFTIWSAGTPKGQSY